MKPIETDPPPRARLGQNSQRVEIGVYYDFASVLCFVAQQVMARVGAELREASIELFWLPLDLTVLTGWQRGDRMRGRRRSVAQKWTVDQLIEEPIVVPEIWMDSRLASAVALGLKGDEREELWRQRVFDRVYRQGGSLDDRDCIVELGQELELELPSHEDALRVVELATREAEAVGVVGVPSFLLGSWPVGGIQDPATMVGFLQRYADRARQKNDSSLN